MQAFELLDERHGIDDHAVSHDILDMRIEDSRRNALQGELAIVEYYRMAGIVAALMTHHDIGLARIEIRNLALALVAPLGAYDYQRIIHKPRYLYPPHRGRDVNRCKNIIFCRSAHSAPAIFINMFS